MDTHLNSVKTGDKRQLNKLYLVPASTGEATFVWSVADILYFSGVRTAGFLKWSQAQCKLMWQTSIDLIHMAAACYSPNEHRHANVLAVFVDVAPCVLDDFRLGVGQWLGSFRAVLVAAVRDDHVVSTKQLRWRRWWGRRRGRLPARHPPAAQKPGGSQQRAGQVGRKGGGKGHGQLRPHGGSWRGEPGEKKDRTGGGQETGVRRGKEAQAVRKTKREKCKSSNALQTLRSNLSCFLRFSPGLPQWRSSSALLEDTQE